jgi:acylpyruvate hydrolase
MKLATVRMFGETRAVRIDEGGTATVLPEADVSEVFRDPDWRLKGDAPGALVPSGALDFAPLIPRPDKIICVGLNYRSHIEEMGHELPQFPTLFAKYRSALIGDQDDIILPAASTMVDWEAELGVVIGEPIRHASREEAAVVIAGYTIVNDVTARDWQRRSSQFLQGKTFESTTPVGPWLVTPDEPGAAPGPDQRITCTVDGEVVQDATTGDLLFDPFDLVAYVSTIVTLLPGDIIATGTPAGVGAGRTPPRFLDDGQVVVTAISGIGELRNRCRRDPA